MDLLTLICLVAAFVFFCLSALAVPRLNWDGAGKAALVLALLLHWAPGVR